jgi:hypothetical protein
MKVLGDWDFNIKALLVGDIGVVPKTLANYHVRPSTGPKYAAYLNSINPQSRDQILADAAYRNRWLRRDIEKGAPGLGFLLAIARLQKRPGLRRSVSQTIRSLFRSKTGS